MPSPPDRPLIEGSGVSPSSKPVAKRAPLLEYGVVVLVAALAIGYAFAMFEHESIVVNTLSSTASTQHETP